jgi:NADH-quinone oxidoreductase subunit M
MGYIIFGLGSESVLGISGAIMLYVSHGLGKALLFMMAGSIILQTGTRNMEKLGGLSSKMPYTAVLTMIGALTIMGVPITSGFMAEWVLFNGSLQDAIDDYNYLKIAAFAVAISTTVLTSAYILWMYKKIFFGIVPETLKNVGDSSRYVIVTMGVLAAFTLILGLYPDLFYSPIINYVENLYGNSSDIAQIKQTTEAQELRISDQLIGGFGDSKTNGFSQIGTGEVDEYSLQQNRYL